MSKAFTREDDTGDGEPLPPLPSLLPPGASNLMTAAGAERTRQELAALAAERSHLLAKVRADPPDLQARDELKRLDQKFNYLERSLRTAEIVPPPPEPHDVVRFGASVTVREPGGTETTYHIVGVDESDADNNRVSWFSPVARTLLNARVGDSVTLRLPRRAIPLEIVGIKY